MRVHASPLTIQQLVLRMKSACNKVSKILIYMFLSLYLIALMSVTLFTCKQIDKGLINL